MLEIKELYNLPYKALSLTDWVLRDDWFPELSASLTCFNSEVLEVLQAEARLQVRELVNVYGDGYRVTEMHTLWFDGEPVFIVQNAGRGGVGPSQAMGDRLGPLLGAVGLPVQQVLHLRRSL